MVNETIETYNGDFQRFQEDDLQKKDGLISQLENLKRQRTVYSANKGLVERNVNDFQAAISDRINEGEIKSNDWVPDSQGRPIVNSDGSWKTYEDFAKEQESGLSFDKRGVAEKFVAPQYYDAQAVNEFWTKLVAEVGSTHTETFLFNKKDIDYISEEVSEGGEIFNILNKFKQVGESNLEQLRAMAKRFITGISADPNLKGSFNKLYYNDFVRHGGKDTDENRKDWANAYILDLVTGSKEITNNLHFTKKLGLESKKALELGDLKQFSELMNVHWEEKKKRSGTMSNPNINHWYELALKNGALGGKLVGAGGGGFLMFYANDRQKLLKTMTGEGLTETRFRFDFEGSKVIIQN